MSKTHTIAVIDSSGSMFPYVNDTIGGYNQYLDDLAADTANEHLITTVLFSSRAYRHMLCLEASPASAPRLDSISYQTRGNTALLDAMGHTINQMVNVFGKGDKVVVVSITDGEENASLDFTFESIKTLIGALTASGWVFIHLSVGFDDWENAAKMGVPASNYMGTRTASPETVAAAYNTAGKFSIRHASGATGQSLSDITAEHLAADEIIAYPED